MVIISKEDFDIIMQNLTEADDAQRVNIYSKKRIQETIKILKKCTYTQKKQQLEVC